LQARHRAKNAVIDTDVLAEHDHVRIILTSAIVLSREFAALRGIDLGQISIEVIEHGCGPARCRCQVAFSRRLDEAGPLPSRAAAIASSAAARIASTSLPSTCSPLNPAAIAFCANVWQLVCSDSGTDMAH
jgi:hypothetical protein